LSNIIINKLQSNSEELYIDEDYSDECTYKMKFIIKEVRFDPASAGYHPWV
jgi:hypothetical protein